MYEINYVEFGNMVRQARENANLTQQLLAEKLGTSPQHLSNIERAKKRTWSNTRNRCFLQP